MSFNLLSQATVAHSVALPSVQAAPHLVAKSSSVQTQMELQKAQLQPDYIAVPVPVQVSPSSLGEERRPRADWNAWAAWTPAVVRAFIIRRWGEAVGEGGLAGLDPTGSGEGGEGGLLGRGTGDNPFGSLSVDSLFEGMNES